MNKFTSILAAALVCGSISTFAQDDEIKVTPAIDDNFDPAFTFNKDYSYYGIYLDDETKEANLSDNQYIYIGPDTENGRNLWIWDGQSSFVENPSGTNSFNVPGAYMSYKVGGAGWSGIGYNIAADAAPLNLSGINDDYKFHIALKSTSNDTFYFYLTDGNGKQADLVFGSKAFPTDTGDKEPIANFERDDEWYNIDIPMTYLEDQFGLSFKKNATEYKDKNILCLLAGSNEGTVIDYDAVFFYGPKTTNGINDAKSDATNGVKTYFTITGEKVSASYAKGNKGIYVVKEGNTAKKVVID